MAGKVKISEELVSFTNHLAFQTKFLNNLWPMTTFAGIKIIISPEIRQVSCIKCPSSISYCLSFCKLWYTKKKTFTYSTSIRSIRVFVRDESSLRVSHTQLKNKKLYYSYLFKMIASKGLVFTENGAIDTDDWKQEKHHLKSIDLSCLFSKVQADAGEMVSGLFSWSPYYKINIICMPHWAYSLLQRTAQSADISPVDLWDKVK